MKLSRNFFLSIVLLVSLFVKSQTQFKIVQNELILPSPILFESGNEKIKIDESKPSLLHIKEYLEAKSYVSLLRIESHSDNDGNASINQKLTEARAKSVYNWLVANGVDCKKLIAVGFGSTKPIADNSTPEGKAENRRISIYMAELRDRAIGGMPIDSGGSVSATCR